MPVILENAAVKITVDHCIPTAQIVYERHPNLILTIKGEKRIAILEVAVSWETRILEREREKKHKYRKLVVDMLSTKPGWEVKVFPMVVRCLGTIGGMRTELENLSKQEIKSLVKELQMKP